MLNNLTGKSIKTGKNKSYSEGAHIKPLGSPHNGSDTKNNIIILCPNHHVEFDYGVLTIDPKNNLIKHIDSSNTMNGTHTYYDRLDLNEDYLNYHNKYIFKKR